MQVDAATRMDTYSYDKTFRTFTLVRLRKLTHRFTAQIKLKILYILYVKIILSLFILVVIFNMLTLNNPNKNEKIFIG